MFDLFGQKSRRRTDGRRIRRYALKQSNASDLFVLATILVFEEPKLLACCEGAAITCYVTS